MYESHFTRSSSRYSVELTAQGAPLVFYLVHESHPTEAKRVDLYFVYEPPALSLAVAVLLSLERHRRRGR